MLAGWTAAQIAMLFGGVSIAITGLYLLRMRRRRVVVPFAALWRQVTRQSESRQLWRRLRRLFSWLVQLLVVALICFALGDPRTDAWSRDAKTLAIVIDRSASMSAATEDGDTRLDEALSRALAEIAALGPSDRALLVAASETVEVIAPLGSSADLNLAAVERLEAAPGEADLESALALAQQLIADQSNPQIVVVTDGAVADGSIDALKICAELPDCKLATFSGPVENVAITAFAARRYPEAYAQVEVLAQVHNLGDTAADVVLVVTADEVALARRTLHLQPGQARREVIANVDAARSKLTAHLESPTGSATQLGPAFDDRAYAVVPPIRPIELGLVTDGKNLFLEAALLTLEEHVRLRGFTPQDARTDPQALSGFDLVIFDVGNEPLPAELPDTNVVLFDPWRQAESPCPIARGEHVSRPYLTEQDRKHLLLQNIILKDVNIGRGTTFATVPGDIVLVRSLGAPIVVLREAKHAILAVGFDPRQSDLPLRTAFPLFIDNIVRYFGQREAGFVASAAIGRSREIRLAEIGLDLESGARARIEDPFGRVSEVPVERGIIRVRAAVPGFYRLTEVGSGNDAPSAELAFNQASASASDLHSRLDDLQLPPTAVADASPSPAAPGEGPLWTVLLVAAIAIVTIEWATYHRRVTV